MHKPKIFLLKGDKDSLIELEETEWLNEKILQEFLTSYPDLVPGDQIDFENPRSWLLVSREMGIPGADQETGRWSIDHLFVDQEGIPTFIECKRSSDTRVRREVVAQMLDYAANGTKYWNVEVIRQVAAETANKQGKMLNDEIRKLTGDEEVDVEQFWDRVDENLRDNRVRLIFISDSIPKELRRMVEFLNEEMKTVEVLAVEIKQYRNIDQKDQIAIVPRVIGFTERAYEQKRSSSFKRKTTEREFLESCSEIGKKFFKEIIDPAIKKGHFVSWGTVGFSIRGRLPSGNYVSLLYGYPPNNFQVYFDSNIRGTNEEKEIRQHLLNTGLFGGSGEYTLSANINEENVSDLKGIFDFVLEKQEKLLKGKNA